jgi:FKBP-type peptidyl-prolyl cis-trans isomerase
MKIILTICAAVLFCATAFSGCGKNAGQPGSVGEATIDKDSSYAFGMNIGTSMSRDNIVPDIDEFMQGIRDSLGGGKTRFTAEEAQIKLRTAFMELMEKQNEVQAQEETAFLAENSKKPGIVITPSGLQYEVISEGSGAKPAASDQVRVHYKGTLKDGTEFDSSYSGGEPVVFPLNGMIPGWTEGLQLMNAGSKYRLYIPSALGYGQNGSPPVIPPNAPLVFEVELIEIVKQ